MIRITIRGAHETAKHLGDLPQRLRIALIKSMRDSVVAIQSLAKEKAPVFRGLLRVSIVQKVEEREDRIVGEVGSGLPYASVVESGRTTGWFPPVKDLRLWARRKLGDESKAFVIGRAIKSRGFRAQPYLAPAAEAAAPRVFLIFSQRLNALFQGGEG